MIQKALLLIKQSLNENLKREFSLSSDLVTLSNLSDSEELDKKIVFFVTSINEEALPMTRGFRNEIDEKQLVTQTLLSLNLHVLFCAKFTGENYPEGLVYLSSLITYLKDNPIINTAGYRLSIEMQPLDIQQTADLWKAIGANLLPSALYKLKLIENPVDKVDPLLPSIKSNKVL